MTVVDITPRVQHTGDGSTTSFNIPFAFLNRAYLEVYVGEDRQYESVEGSPAGYVLDDLTERAGGQGYETGGKVVLAVAPASGATVTILRHTPIVQETDYYHNGQFYPETVETTLDRLTMIFQEIADAAARMIAPPANPGTLGPDRRPTLRRMIWLGKVTENLGSGQYSFQVVEIPDWGTVGEVGPFKVSGDVTYSGYEFNLCDTLKVNDFVCVHAMLDDTDTVVYRIRAGDGYCNELKALVFKLTDCDTSEVTYTDETKTPGISALDGKTATFEETGDSCFQVEAYSNPDPPEPPPPPPPYDPLYDDPVDMEGPRYVWQSQSGLSYLNKNFVKTNGSFLVVMQGNYLGQINDVAFRNCWFKHSRPESAYEDSSGAYFYYCTNLLFEDCVFEDNGWYNDIRYFRNHGIYLNRCAGVRFVRCKFIGNSAQGCKILGCSDVDFVDCEFEDNLIDIGVDSRERTNNLNVLRCTFTNTGGYQNPPAPPGVPIAWSVVISYGTNVSITDCVWVGPAVASNTYGVNTEPYPSENVVLTRPDFTAWTGTKWINRIGAEFSVVDEVT